MTVQPTRQFDSVAANERPLWFLGALTFIKAAGDTTNGAFGLVEQLIPAGFASPYHLHHLEDEAFYVLQGTVRFVCDGKWVNAGPGAYIYAPRNIPHGFKIAGDSPARMLILCAPAGFEQFVIEMSEPATALTLAPASPPDMPKLIGLAAKYRIDILGPLPEETRVYEQLSPGG
jgi:quercetin dioxygenase-like cupin family protein